VPAARLDVAQLPHIEGAKWAGLPFPAEEKRPTSGLLSMVLYRPSILGLLITPHADDEWVGLMLDEWTEMIPSTSEKHGHSFPLRQSWSRGTTDRTDSSAQHRIFLMGFRQSCRHSL
jgi:hypothetical protein